MSVKLLIEHHLEFLSLKGGYRCSSESPLAKMSNCWKSHAAAQIIKGLECDVCVHVVHEISVLLASFGSKYSCKTAPMRRLARVLGARIYGV